MSSSRSKHRRERLQFRSPSSFFKANQSHHSKWDEQNQTNNSSSSGFYKSSSDESDEGKQQDQNQPISELSKAHIESSNNRFNASHYSEERQHEIIAQLLSCRLDKRNSYQQFTQHLQRCQSTEELFGVIQKWIESNLYPDDYAINQLIKQLNKYGTYQSVKAVYLDAVKKGINNNFICTSMINAAGENGDFEFADEEVFKVTTKLNIGMYTAMIKAAFKNNHLDRGESLFNTVIRIDNHMRKRKQKKEFANEITFITVIDGAGKNKNLVLAKIAFREALNRGKVNHKVRNAMINVAGENGDFEFADEIFKATAQSDIIMYNAMIKVAFKNNHLDRGEALFNKVIEIDDEMRKQGKEFANEITFITTIDRAGKIKNLPLAEQAFSEAKNRRKVTNLISQAMIDAYVCNDHLEDGEALFKEMNYLFNLKNHSEIPNSKNMEININMEESQNTTEMSDPVKKRIKTESYFSSPMKFKRSLSSDSFFHPIERNQHELNRKYFGKIQWSPVKKP